MKTYKMPKHNLFAILLATCVGLVSAQQKQNVLNERFNVNEDVTINVDTRYTNVIFETWNKDEVVVEGYIETTEDVSKEDAERIAESWSVNASGNSDNIQVTSSGSLNWNGPMNLDLSALQSLQHLPMDFIGPMVEGIVAPMQNMPVLPKGFYNNLGDMNFDYEAYKERGEAYLKEYEEKMEERFGDDYEKRLESWGEDFGEKMEAWGKQFEEKYGKEMEAWGEKFSQDMEVWGEEFGKDMEAWASKMAEQYGGEYSKTETSTENGGKTTVVKYRSVKPANFTNDDVKRTLIIKMPKNGKLRLDVRHGEITLAELMLNLKAKLSHTKLAANIIDGGQTSIYAAYSPVQVKQWNYGTLNTNYVKECVIDSAKDIKLEANSSDVVIKKIENTGVISGTFSRIAIPDIESGINNLDVVLENSDFIVTLPKQAFNFTFNGDKSGLKYPETLTVNTVKNAGRDRVTGFYKTRNTPTNLVISARFSNVILK